MPKSRTLVLTALALGLAARLAFGLGYWVGKPLTQDEQEYLALARSLAAGRGFTYGSEMDPPRAADAAGGEIARPRAPFARAPGYPFVLAPLVDPGAPPPSSVPTTVKIAQALVGTVGVLLIGLVARRLAGPRAALIALWIAAVHPPLVWITGYALTETVYSCLALGSVLLLDGAVRARADRHAGTAQTRRPSRPTDLWLGAMAGLTAGAAALVRPETVLFVGLAAGWLAIRRQHALAVTLLLGATMAIGPWTARNLRVHDRFVLINATGGVTFWTGNHPLAIGEGDMAANPAIKLDEVAFRRRHPGLSAEELEPRYYGAALAYITEHPVWWLGLLARKAFYLVVPIGPSYTLHSWRYLGATWVTYAALLPLAVMGFLRLRAAGRHVWPLWLLATSVVVTSLVFMPQERFRIPVLDPTLIVCASAWIATRVPDR